MCTSETRRGRFECASSHTEPVSERERERESVAECRHSAAHSPRAVPERSIYWYHGQAKKRGTQNNRRDDVGRQTLLANILNNFLLNRSSLCALDADHRSRDRSGDRGYAIQVIRELARRTNRERSKKQRRIIGRRTTEAVWWNSTARRSTLVELLSGFRALPDHREPLSERQQKLRLRLNQEPRKAEKP